MIRNDWRLASKLIDHTLLKPEATREQVAKLCREAAEYGFHAVMVNPSNIAQCKAALRGAGVVVGTVIGFPLGATTTTSKLAEASDSLRLGATELDMVINIGALKSGDRDLVQMEMQSLANLCHRSGALLKVILETALLTTEEKILVCQLAAAAEVDFVKTSTGFAGSRGHRCRCFADARRGWQKHRSEGGGRNPHRLQPAGHGRCRSQPRGQQRQRGHCQRTWRKVED